MNTLTLKHLRYFLAVAKHGHFGRAAEACSISQPALSLQIRDLESTLGHALVERSTRVVRLTAFGEALVERAADILRSVEELEALAKIAEQPNGAFRLGIIPTIAPYLLPKVATTLKEAFPALDLQPREAMTAVLVQELSEGSLDAALLALPTSEPHLEDFALFDEPFVLVRHEDDADLPVPDQEQMREMRLLLLDEGHCFRDQALSFCKGNGNAPREMLHGSSLTTLVQMVGAGMGITLIPQMAVHIETRSAPVEIAKFPNVTPQRTVGMVWRRTSPLCAQYRRIAEALKKL